MVRINWKTRAGFLPERVPMPEEPVNELKVVLKLPRPMESHNGRLRFTPPIISHLHHGHDIISRPSKSSGLMAAQPDPHPRELIVSIPFTALCQQEEEPLAQETEPMEASEEQHRHSHHKHKKHKKHKKHHHHHQHHHDSASQEEVRGQFGAPEMIPRVMADVTKYEPSSYMAPPVHSTPTGATKTVAPLRIQVPKPSPPLDSSSSRTLSKHKTHSHSHHDEDARSSGVQGSDRHGRPPLISQDRDSLALRVIPSGKHMHSTTHTHKHHHHKHKEKRHHHRSSGYQGDEHVTGYHGNEDVIGEGDDDDDDGDLNEQGQAVLMRITPPTRPVGGKPTAFMKAAEERKTFTNDEFSPIGSAGEKVPTLSHEGHRHHKKKKKKHHKHSKHSFSHSEPEVSPPVACLSGMESEDSQQGYFATTPLSTGTRTNTTTQAHAHPIAAIPQEKLVANQESISMRSPIKESRRLSQEASGVGHSSFQETQRSSQDSGSSSSSSRLPLRRLSQDKRTSKLKAQSPDVQPPPHKQSRMDDEMTPPSLKLDISQTKGLDIEPRDTPSPIISTQQVQPSLRHQTSHGSSDSVASTPVSVSRPLLGATRRSSTTCSTGGERTQSSNVSAMAPSPPVQNPAEMKTTQGKACICKTKEAWYIPS